LADLAVTSEDRKWLAELAQNVRISRSPGAHPLSWMAQVADQERQARATFGDAAVDAAIMADRIRAHRECYCTGACEPPPKGRGACPAAPKTGEDLKALIEQALEVADEMAKDPRLGVARGVPAMALVEAYVALFGAGD
jgi:hypothetical protein